MEFPMFHLDWLNDRFLIAVIAILHVFINHGLAVGFIPYITWLEQKGLAKAGPNEVTHKGWDELVYQKMKVAFIITTTVGAMTGVGIWFSVALVSPNSIGSLIRVFYWAWFIEWLVFVTEVVLILIYYLSWKRSNANIQSKVRHIRFGWFLSIFSWITMAIIVAILGFMMDPGNWNNDKTLWSGFTNPIYLPQLAFRTPAAMLIAGTLGMLLTAFFARRKAGLRTAMVRDAGKWILGWMPAVLLGAVWYWQVMPSAMKANMSTAVGTMEFESYYNLLKYFILGTASLAVIIAVWALWRPQKIKWAYVIVPCLFAFGFLGIFERVREFVRKPYIIGGYMYSNLLREEDYPLYQRDGILKHATYSKITEITESNKLEAGKEVFLYACSRCHTASGINSITSVFERMYASTKPLDEAAMAAYIPGMHKARTYMPPFPGNKQEIDALAAYIKYLQLSGESLEGAQRTGVVANPLHRINEQADEQLSTIENQGEPKSLVKIED